MSIIQEMPKMINSLRMQEYMAGMIKRLTEMVEGVKWKRLTFSLIHHSAYPIRMALGQAALIPGVIVFSSASISC